MNAPAGWQKGSFRGVPFRTEDGESRGGRRGVVHEFPQAEKPVWEDLGRVASSFSFQCHVTGPDHIAAANALADALDAPGAGTLIHPWRGAMQVAVTDYARMDSTVDGGITRFSIAFVETGLVAPQPASSDTQADAVARADATIAAAPGQFAGRFSVAGVTGFVEQAAGDVVRYASLAVQARAALAGGIGPALSFLTGNLAILGNAGALLRAPIDLARTIIGTVQALSLLTGSSGTPVRAVQARGFRALMDWGVALPPVPGATPARAIQRANQAAIVQLVNLTASAELVRCHAATVFPSYDDAVAARDDATGRLDALALRQADAGDDAGAALYDALRLAVTADLTARGGSLARLQTHVPAVTQPALVIAQRIYGDPATIAARGAEIVARNKVRHPGFVPGGIPLQVLSVEAANG